jgi:hydrogenase nickel incorporation protein HypA/HybF
MHEYSIASSLLRSAEEHARKHEAARVVRIELRIGEMAGVEIPMLETAWSLVRERSICEGVDLTIRRVRTRWECKDCESAIPLGAQLVCPACGGRARLATGDELFLDRIEMEVT